MTTISIIIISIFGLALGAAVIWLFIWQNNKNRFRNQAQKCFVKACQVWFKRSAQNKRYCRFHLQVQQYHLGFVAKNDPLKNKTLMYMHTNAQLFRDKHLESKIFGEFQRASAKHDSTS